VRQPAGRIDVGRRGVDRRDEREPDARHRANEPRPTRIVAEQLSQLTDLLSQRIVGDRSVIPHRIQERTLGHELPMTLNEHEERVEGLGREVDLDSQTCEPSIRHVEDEIRKSIDVGLHRHRALRWCQYAGVEFGRHQMAASIESHEHA
jgi:hypothetical protein